MLSFFPAVSVFALTSVEGYHGYLLFAWMYGAFLGGHSVALSVYTLEKMRIRHFPRAWGYVQGAKAIPLLIGIPAVGYIQQGTGSTKAGFYFSFSAVLAGSMSLFLMECYKSKRHHHEANCDGGGQVSHQSSVPPEHHVLNEMMSEPVPRPSGGSIGGVVFGGGMVAMPSTSVKCTCGKEEVSQRRLSLSGAAGSQGVEAKEVSIADDGAVIASVVPAVDDPDNDIQLASPDAPPEDEIDEEEEEEDVLPNGVKPEMLTCISEENLFENLDVDYFGDLVEGDGEDCICSHVSAAAAAEAVVPGTTEDPDDDFLMRSSPASLERKRDLLMGGMIGSSFSEPDLCKLFGLPPSDMVMSPSSSSPSPPPPPPQSAAVSVAVTLNRQKTWHHFNKQPHHHQLSSSGSNGGGGPAGTSQQQASRSSTPRSAASVSASASSSSSARGGGRLLLPPLPAIAEVTTTFV